MEIEAVGGLAVSDDTDAEGSELAFSGIACVAGQQSRDSAVAVGRRDEVRLQPILGGGGPAVVARDAVCGEGVLEGVGQPWQVGDAGVAALRSIRQEPDHRDAGGRGPEVDSAEIARANVGEVGLDLARPVDRSAQAIALGVVHGHGVAKRHDARTNVDGRTELRLACSIDGPPASGG